MSTSNNNNNNFFSTSPANFQAGRGYGTYRTPPPPPPPFNNDSRRSYPSMSLSVLPHAILDGNGRVYNNPWRMPEDTLITERLGSLASFPSQPYSPQQTLPISNITARDNQSLPRTRSNQFNMQATRIPQREYEETNSTTIMSQGEQNSAVLKKLRKEIYNPVPKMVSRRLCLYYRDQNNNIANSKAKENKAAEEEGKRCAVCLEDFEAKELVMVTQCNHMFHEDCIVPWLKSNGQCPVCRHQLFERPRGNNNGVTSVNAQDANYLSVQDLISIIRAIEEPFFEYHNGAVRYF